MAEHNHSLTSRHKGRKRICEKSTRLAKQISWQKIHWKATEEYLDHRGTKNRVFRVRFRAPFLPPLFPHSSLLDFWGLFPMESDSSHPQSRVLKILIRFPLKECLSRHGRMTADVRHRGSRFVLCCSKHCMHNECF